MSEDAFYRASFWTGCLVGSALSAFWAGAALLFGYFIG